MPPRLSLLLAVLAVWPLWTAAGWAQDDRVQVDADALGYEEDGDVVSARGNVVVTKGDARLTADTVRVRRSRNALDARGNVVLADPQGDVRADRLRLELTDETGTIENGTIRLPRRQYTIAGRTLQKLYGQSYRVTDGVVTTCECDRMEDADWSIAADTLDVTVGGTGRLRHGVLRVRDVPLFYVPYGAMAVRTDRHSGLLAPRYGFSNKRGFQWEQPLYWAISKSQDLTVTTDVETSERAGLLGEYRYAPGRSMEGQLWVSYFNEQLRERVSSPAPVHRWSVVGSHRHALTPDVQLYGDLFLVSDDFFLRDMNVAFHPTLERSDRRSKRFTDSRIGGVKTWEHAQLRAEATYYQDSAEQPPPASAGRGSGRVRVRAAHTFSGPPPALGRPHRRGAGCRGRAFLSEPRLPRATARHRAVDLPAVFPGRLRVRHAQGDRPRNRPIG